MFLENSFNLLNKETLSAWNNNRLSTLNDLKKFQYNSKNMIIKERHWLIGKTILGKL